MAVTETRPEAAEAEPTAPSAASVAGPTGLAGVVGSGDHKVVGRLFIASSLAFALVAGVAGQLVAVERIDIDTGSSTVLSDDTLFQTFTLHSVSGTFLFLLPLLIGLALVVVPLQVGAPTVAFPRAAALAFWTFLISGGLLVASYLMNGGPAGGSENGVDLWAASLAAVVASLLVATTSIVTTVLTMRAPGMTIGFAPMFSWSMLTAGTIWLLTLPVLISGLILMYVDHSQGAVFFGRNEGGLIYDRIVWAFRGPQVFAYAVPVLGIVTDALCTLNRTRLPFRRVALGAVGTFAVLGFGAFTQVTVYDQSDRQPLAIAMALLIVLPLLVLLGLWADLFRRGRPRLASPLVFAVAAALMLLVGVLTGAVGAISAWDLRNTTWDAGVSHHVLLAALLAGLGGLHFWATKVLRRPLAEGTGTAAALLALIGTVLIGFPDLISGAFGSGGEDVSGVSGLNAVIAVGGFFVLFAVLLAVVNVLRGVGRPAGEVPSDPWEGQTLEWLTASPPSYANFDAELPEVTSEAPLLDRREAAEAASGGASGPADEGGR